jgi:hypothetical protein
MGLVGVVLLWSAYETCHPTVPSPSPSTSGTLSTPFNCPFMRMMGLVSLWVYLRDMPPYRSIPPLPPYIGPVRQDEPWDASLGILSATITLRIICRSHLRGCLTGCGDARSPLHRLRFTPDFILGVTAPGL